MTLIQMYDWAEELGMEFNSSKLLHREEIPRFQYLAPEGNVIEEKYDFEGRISNDLSFTIPRKRHEKVGL